MTSFLSTFVNKVDRKGRVSVPAPFRAVLADETYQGIIAFSSLTVPAINAFGRTTLNDLNLRHHERTLGDGDFERAIFGSNSLMDTVQAMVHELPFDGEGRVVLPAPLAEEAGITDRATFVGRGSRFEIWSPERFEEHHRNSIDALRDELARKLGGGR